MSSPSTPTLHLRDAFRLTPKPANAVEVAIVTEQQARLLSMFMVMGFAFILNSTVVAFVFLGNHPLGLIAAWWIPCIIQGASMAWAGFKLRSTARPANTCGAMIRLSERLCGLTGLWFGMTLLIFPNDSIEMTIFLTGLLMGMSAGTANFLSTMPRASVRFIIAAVLPTIPSIVFGTQNWSPITDGGAISYSVVFGALAFTLIMVVLNNNFRAYGELVQLVASRENSRNAFKVLQGAIDSSSDAFAVFDQSGDEIVSNKAFKNIKEANGNIDFVEGTRCFSDGRWRIAKSSEIPDIGSVAVLTDVSLLMRRERELLTAQAEAETARTSKTKFLGLLSHELRSPLNAILGFSNLMGSDSNVDIDSKKMGEYSDYVRESAERIAELVDQIIDYSRLESGRITSQTHLVSPEELFQLAVSGSRKYLGRRFAVEPNIKIEKSIESMRVDATLLSRVLSTVISNAAQHTTDDRIEVRLSAKGDDGEILIRDFGNGMDAATLAKVFEPFFQAESGIARKKEGTGLGLTLAKSLLELIGGSILMESKLGKGTIVKIHLPGSVKLKSPERRSFDNTATRPPQAKVSNA